MKLIASQPEKPEYSWSSTLPVKNYPLAAFSLKSCFQIFQIIESNFIE